MSWLAVLLAAAVAASAPAPRKHHRVTPAHRLAKKPPKHKGVTLKRPRTAPLPSATPVPQGTPGPPAPTPTATPPPVYPSRTRVVLDEWTVQSSYIVMKAGPLEFNVDNLGEDDHNLSIGGRDETVAVPPGDSAQLLVTLAPGTYTLYCSLPEHAQRGMTTTLTVR